MPKGKLKKGSNDNGDWVYKLDVFLNMNREIILQGKGNITVEIAKIFAESEFDKYRFIQDKEYISDFDKLVEETK